MAKPGDLIEAPLAGLKIKFHETERSSNGHTLKFEYFIEPGKGFIRPHVHLNQVEHYEILSGTAVYQHGGVERTAQAGDVITNEPGQAHINPWNRDGDEGLHLLVTAHPSLGVEYFFETWFGLVRDNRDLDPKTHEQSLFQNVLTISHIPTQTYAAALPRWFQAGLLYPALRQVARIRRYRVFYPAYTDVAEAEGSFAYQRALRPEDLDYTPAGAPPGTPTDDTAAN